MQTTSLLKIRWMLPLALGAFLLAQCSTSEKKPADEKPQTEEKKQDSAQPVIDQTWIDIQAKVSRMTNETSYDEIVSELGKPYDEYASPSLPEEYVMFYNVPGVKGAMFWVMIDTKNKTFLYWSGETQEK